MTTAEQLRAALALMNDNGRHWFKGDYQAWLDDDGDEMAYCSAGAIFYVVTGDPESFGSEETKPAVIALGDVLKDEVETSESIVRDDWSEYDYAHERITRWNDAGERTWEEVVAKFEEAAKRAEAAS